MLSLAWPAPAGRPLRLLCLGAHADDIEIGCGGTVLRLLEERPDAHVAWVVFSAAGARRAEAERGAALFLEGAGAADVRIEAFRDGFFPYAGGEIKERFEALKDTRPDLVLTHHGADRHQDHRTVSELAWNTFRDHLILEYEVPKWDGDLGRPNGYVPLGREVVDRKLAHLAAAFPSQAEKDWFDAETFRGLLRLRGVECRAAEGYAEAFHVRKATLGGARGP